MVGDDAGERVNIVFYFYFDVEIYKHNTHQNEYWLANMAKVRVVIKDPYEILMLL